MKWIRPIVFALPVLLSGCQSGIDQGGTLAQLRQVRIDIKEEQLEGGIEKAMASYQRFLEETPGSALAPEAIRRLADLKVEREYGTLTGGAAAASAKAPSPSTGEGRGGGEAESLPAHHPSARPLPSREVNPPLTAAQGESEADFERRAAAGQPAAAADDLEQAGALEAIALYQKLLNDHPTYERNDQVLYQMTRAYEELGRVEEGMEVMNRLVRDYPRSRYIDEVQFRRAEYFFMHRRYLDAEDAYKSIVDIGVASSFFELALYKLGWTFYKQELYEDAMDRFIALLDHKVSIGYDFAQTDDEQERKRVEDTFRVISLGFSYLGGAEAAVDYFSSRGPRRYEDGIYSNLGEYYFDKRRYSDAAAAYDAFVRRNPFHKVSPRFHMRIIEIYTAGAFPTLVLDAKKAFATTYGLQGEYWRRFDPAAYPEVLGYLKTNLTDLAHHYHALYQDPKHAEEKRKHFEEALHWYREFIASFPAAPESPVVNYELADLLLENKDFGRAAVEYEKTAYGYPRHEKAATAGYAAVYAYRQQLGAAPSDRQEAVKREAVRSSLKFAETFPEHEKAAIVLGAAADDLYELKDFEPAVGAARQLIAAFPGADVEVRRAAWLVVGHGSYELLRYGEAEAAYVNVLDLLPAGDKARAALVDNLAAAIYQQGEEAKAREDYRGAADHFLRVGRMAATSTIRATAEYDAAAALIQLKDWTMAATVLQGFRELFPGHKLQPEVTKKIAYVYREDGRLSLAAGEYERIERESKDDDVRREALTLAAELYLQAGSSARALDVYRRYVGSFPRPVELNLETRHKIAEMLKGSDRKGYLSELKEIVAIDAAAGSERTARTRYLAANAALVLAEPKYEAFVEVRLVKPFEANLRKKRELMKGATQEFIRLMDYEVGEVTAAATFYLAEINAHFSQALMQSERPEGLSPVELEQYELAIEEQAYPFEEKAIAVHESNLQLISQGIYNGWIDKSLQKLAAFVPARYAKAEEGSGIVDSLDSYVFEIKRPVPPTPEAPAAEAVAAEPAVVQAPVAATAEAAPAQTSEVVEKPSEVEKPAEAKEPAQVAAGEAVDGGGKGVTNPGAAVKRKSAKTQGTEPSK